TLPPPPSSPLFPYTTLFRSPTRRVRRQANSQATAKRSPLPRRQDVAVPLEAQALLRRRGQVELAAGHVGAAVDDRDADASAVVADRKSTRLNSSHVAISYAV